MEKHYPVAARLLYLAGAILAFLMVMRLAFTSDSLPDWLGWAGLCAGLLGLALA